MSEMTENTNQTEQNQAPSPQWVAFIEAVNQAALKHGVQAVVASAAVPSQGGFGPTQVHSHGWVLGPAPEEWRNNVGPVFAQACSAAAAAIMVTKAAPTDATAPAAEEVSA